MAARKAGLLLGASNAVGLGTGTDLDLLRGGALGGTLPSFIWWNGDDNFPTAAWENLDKDAHGSGQGNQNEDLTGQAAHSHQFGTEFTLSNEAFSEWGEFYLIKMGISATYVSTPPLPLAGQDEWSKAARELYHIATGWPYDPLLTRLTAAAAALAPDTLDIQFVAFIGWAEAQTVSMSQRYAAAIELLYRNLEEDLSIYRQADSPLPWLEVRAPSWLLPAAAPGRAALLTSQQAFAAKFDNVKLIVTDSLIPQPDLVHIDSAGLLDLGELIWDGFMNVPIPPEAPAVPSTPHKPDRMREDFAAVTGEDSESGERLDYYPGGDTLAGIKVDAIVERELVLPDGTVSALTDQAVLHVAAGSANGGGVLATVEAGKDLVDVPMRFGEAVTRAKVINVAANDAGGWTLEVKT